MSRSSAQTQDAVAELCPACGMCCNGVLFGDVALRPGDSARRLAAAGLTMFRKGRQRCFSQPCACFDGRACRIYDERPQRCASFECRLLQRVQSGRTSAAAALRAIAQTRRCVERIQELVRELGHTDEQVPLNLRYAAILAQPIELAGPENILQRRRELAEVVELLTQMLELQFLA
ncbi:MAG: YkgJ family cysteine cluster protein [Verrucomicrobiae bacterium]|nr:YkgJ family cysteine cluster protein [Verrucomicrobiae bacterium]